MKVDLMGSAIGIGAGALDEFLERNDAANARIEASKKWTTWVRVGSVVAGYLGVMFNFMPSYASPVLQSELPLLTKTVAQVIVKPGIGSRAPTAATRPRTFAPVSRTYQPEFEPVAPHAF